MLTSQRTVQNPFIIDQVQSITSISDADTPARTLTFTYSDKGLLKELVDGAGTPVAKTFLFDYDATQGNKNVKLVRVTDPRGNSTDLAYHDPPGDDPQFHWWAKTITDRLGNPTGFAYVDPDGPQGATLESTVTDAEQHATFYRTDGFGRPVLTRDAKQQETALAWDADHNVTQLTEANGAVSTWTYDPKTGFPLTITDAQAVADGTAPTTLTYQTSRNGFVADLIEKRSPEGRRWAFAYDALGNLTSVTDPKGTATPTVPDDFVTSYQYDGLGQLTTITDANEHSTLFDDHDANGFPRVITDALTNVTTFAYDVRGNVLSVTDAKGKASTYEYDVFGRPLASSVPKDQAAGEFIVTPAPVYDANDNVVQATAPNGAVTTATYDAADQLVSSSLPKDTPTGPERTVSFAYDKVGNLVQQTEPKGNLTPGDPADFITRYAYDEIYQLVTVTNAESDRITYAYDNVGNVVTVVDPRKNDSLDPADFTTSYAYDRSHRVTTVTDAAGHAVAYDYDLDGNVTAATDQEGNQTLVTLDERAMVTEVRVPHRDNGGTIAYHTTRYAYDEVGNRTKVITPRGVETTADPDDFVQQVVYDELDRVAERVFPYDPDDPELTTPDKVTYDYDEVGRLVEVSAPPSQGQTARNLSRYDYFDNGWVRQATNPWDISTSYDYNPLGQQTSRTLTSAGGSSDRTMTWEYFPDGKLKARSDDGVPVGGHVVLADNSDTQSIQVTGDWPASTSGSGFHGIDYQTHVAGTGTNTFEWKLDVPADGDYTVSVRYAAGTATDAPYTVEHAGGSTLARVDQTQQAGEWVTLGTFAFTKGGDHRIVLSDAASGTVVADAVKLVRDNSAEPDTEAKTFTYSYDVNGNLVRMADGSSGATVDTYEIDYTGLNQVAEVRELAGGTARNTTSFTYDPNGNPLTRVHDQQHASYTYDARDLVSQVTNGESATDPDPKVTAFTYTPRAQVARETKANGNTVDYTYLLDGMLGRQVERKSDGTLVAEHVLSYNANGHRTRDQAKTMDADNHTALLDRVLDYTYDPRDRIRRVTKTDPGTGGVLETEQYTHDANGNVVSQTIEGVTTTFAYDRNRLQSSSASGVTAAHTYDPFGRLRTVTATGQVLERYSYDGFDRVAEHTKRTEAGATVTTGYTYDPLDRTTTRTRQAGTPDEKTTDFNYLGLSGQVLSEEVAAQVQVTYQYTPWGQRLSQVKHHDDGTRQDAFYGYNPHTDVEQLTSTSGDTLATYGYTAYGTNDTELFTGIDPPTPPDPSADPFNVYRFNHKRFDAATGDYDMGFRQYKPGLNRFISRDLYAGALADLRLGLDPFTSNRYAFAGGNPITGIELDGHRILGDEGPPGTADQLAALASLDQDSYTVGDFGEDLLGVGKGFGEGAVETVAGLWDLGGAAVSCVGDLRGCRDNVSAFGSYVWNNPGEAGKEFLAAFAQPYVEDWQAGNQGEAIGRGIFVGVETYFATKGAAAASSRAPSVGARIGHKIGELKAAAKAGIAGRRAAKVPGVLRVGDVKLPAVPKGAIGRPVESGAGLAYEIPRGTPELDPRVTGIRIMDPVTSGKYPYPNGYAAYMNERGQTVNPLTGKTILPTHPFAHIPLR